MKVHQNNDFVIAWTTGKERYPIYLSAYLAALEERVGLSGENQIRETLGIEPLPVVEETDLGETFSDDVKTLRGDVIVRSRTDPREPISKNRFSVSCSACGGPCRRLPPGHEQYLKSF